MVPPPSVAGSGNMAAPAVRRLGHATDAARSNEVSSATLPFHRYREKEKRRRPTPETPSPNEQAETIPNSTGKCKGSAAYPPQIAVMPDSSLEVARIEVPLQPFGAGEPESADCLTARPRICAGIEARRHEMWRAV